MRTALAGSRVASPSVRGSGERPHIAANLSTEEMIARGEGTTVEYKLTPRWDLRAQKRSADVEKVIVKEVGGFLNCAGGALLVGVADDGTVHGVARDSAAIKSRSLDEFERVLTNFILTEVRDDLASCISITFPRVGGVQIAKVTVAPSPRLAFVKDHSGRRVFYLRTGNQTKPLDAQGAWEYCREHWALESPRPPRV